MSDFVINLCFPLSDLRAFKGTKPARIDRPDWLLPSAGHDFVRACGVIRTRREGAIPGWPGSKFFCRARRMVKLADPETSHYTHTFKRLCFDGTCVGNLDIGLVRRTPPARDHLERLLAMAARVGKKDPRPLVTIGESLAGLFLVSTTPRDQKDAANSHLVVGGDPMMLCDFQDEDGSGALGTALAEQPPLIDWPALAVFQGSLRVHGLDVPVWLLARRPTADDAAARLQGLLCRNVRNLLIRRFCERTALINALRALRRGELDDPVNPRLQKFLLATIQRLSARADEAVVGPLRLDPALAARAKFGELRDVALATVLSSEQAAHADDEALIDDAIAIMDDLGFPAELVDRARDLLGHARQHPPRTPDGLHRERRLHRLLLSLFAGDGDELRMFLTLEFPAIAAELPGAVSSLEKLAFDGLGAVLRREGGPDKLFTALRSERPARVAEIDEVQALWSVPGRA